MTKNSDMTGPGHPHPPAQPGEYASVAAGTLPDPHPSRDASYSPRVGTDQAAKHVVPDGVQNAAPKEPGPEMPMMGSSGDSNAAGGGASNPPKSGDTGSSGQSAKTASPAQASAATGSPKVSTGAAPSARK